MAGGAFVIVYLACILIVGIPILLAEMAIGRHGKLGAYGSFKKITRDSVLGKGVGILCILTSFVILSFYSVVAGWTVEYFIYSLTGSLATLDLEDVGPRFGAFVSSPGKQIFYHTLFMAVTMTLLIKGTKRIEQSVKILMPLLGVMVCIVVGLSTYRYGMGDSLAFLFSADFSKLTTHGVLEALGHAFFTLSLGLGAMVIYGSYLPKKVSLVKSALLIGFFDTAIALMACMMMYPIIFGSGIEISESASMLFTTLTVQFHTLPGGQFVSALFYLLIAFAALSSTISLLEVVVSFVSEELGLKRLHATLLGASTVWAVGLLSALSNGANTTLTNFAFMDKLDYLASNWGLPLGGALISLLAGWFLTKEVQAEELNYKSDSLLLKGWCITVRYVCPVLVFLIMIFKIL